MKFSSIAFLRLNAILLLLLIAAGCSSPALPGETRAEAKLENVEARQLSAAAAAVDAAKFANQANPDGPPKTATAGELNVADANLPPADAEDAREALARVNAALTGQLAEAQTGWNDAIARGHALDAQIASLQMQVAAERATAAALQREATNRLCVLAALLVGGALFVGAALSLAAGLYFSLIKLEYGAIGLALCAACAFFTATQVGSAHFNFLATAVIIAALTALGYTIWHSFAGGATLKNKANGFEAVFSAVRKFAGAAAADTESGAKKLWHWLGVELDSAHKALVADWQKLESVFTPSANRDSQPAPIPPASGAQN